MKKIILPVLLFVFIISLVSAAAPPQVNVNTEVGLDIDFPKIESIPINTNHEFNFHVFNRSNGLRLDNTTVNCSFHLFDITGKHIISTPNMPFAATENDWVQEVQWGNFSQTGGYSILVDCADDGFGGFVSFSFEVTPTGNITEMLGFYYLLYLILFGIVVLGIYGRNAWITSLGGLGLIFMGVYTLNTGIIIFRNVATEVISYTTIGLGAIVAIASALNLIKENM